MTVKLELLLLSACFSICEYCEVMHLYDDSHVSKTYYGSDLAGQDCFKYTLLKLGCFTCLKDAIYCWCIF